MSGTLARIEIKFSRSKLLVPLTLLTFFMLVCLYFFFNPETDSTGTRQYATWFVRALCAIYVLGFFFGAISVSRQLISSKPALILDSEGITDNSSDFSPGFIKWSDIENVSPRELHGARVISLHVVDNIDVSLPNSELARNTFKAFHKLGHISDDISDTVLNPSEGPRQTDECNYLSENENIVDIYTAELSADHDSLYDDICDYHNKQKNTKRKAAAS